MTVFLQTLLYSGQLESLLRVPTSEGIKRFCGNKVLLTVNDQDPTTYLCDILICLNPLLILGSMCSSYCPLCKVCLCSDGSICNKVRIHVTTISL